MTTIAFINFGIDIVNMAIEISLRSRIVRPVNVFTYYQ